MARQNKNLRLSYDAWNELRRLKFRNNEDSYSTVLKKVFANYKGKKPLSDDVRSKVPSDFGDSNSVDRSDKTIVVASDVHQELIAIKTEYMLRKGYSSRGPHAVSVSDILLDLLRSYQTTLKKHN